MKKLLFLTVIIFSFYIAYLLFTKEHSGSQTGFIETNSLGDHAKNNSKMEATLPIQIESQNVVNQKKDNPISVKKPQGTPSITPHEQLENLRAVITKQWDELHECESQFDQMFGKYIKEDDSAKKLNENEIAEIAENMENFAAVTPSSGQMIAMLAQDVNKQIDPKIVQETVGYVKYCRNYEKSSLFYMLISATQNKNEAAKAAFTLLEKELSVLTYNSFYQGLLAPMASLSSFIGKGQKYEEEIKTIQEKINKSIKKESDGFKKCNEGYCFPAQKIMYKESKEIQKDLQRILKEIKEDLP